MSDQKSVLVTGGNRGIGLAICQGLAARGWQVFLGARNADTGRTAAQAIGGAVTPVVVDVSSDKSIAACVATLGEKTKGLTALINNAGIFIDKTTEETVLNIRRERYVECFEVNLFGAVAMTQAALPLLRAGENSRIIHMSSGLGSLEAQNPGYSAYCTSKIALNGIMLQMHQALAGDEIAVYSMCPGWVRTDMGGSEAPRSVEQGADTAIWLAEEGTLEMSGKFYRDRAPIDF